MSVRAVIVDDSAEFLLAARTLLEREGLIVVASAATGAEALRLAEQHLPDVVLLDVELGQESGFDVAERLTELAGWHGRVVLISAHPRGDFVDLLETSPAIGFVPKSRLSAYGITELLDGPSGTPET
jgi:CheY-like chemotaxis protein